MDEALDGTVTDRHQLDDCRKQAHTSHGQGRYELAERAKQRGICRAVIVALGLFREIVMSHVAACQVSRPGMFPVSSGPMMMLLILRSHTKLRRLLPRVILVIPPRPVDVVIHINQMYLEPGRISISTEKPGDSLVPRSGIFD